LVISSIKPFDYFCDDEIFLKMSWFILENFFSRTDMTELPTLKEGYLSGSSIFDQNIRLSVFLQVTLSGIIEGKCWWLSGLLSKFLGKSD
jgi:hypothetical protein